MSIPTIILGSPQVNKIVLELPPTPKVVKFYAHVRVDTGRIAGISQEPSDKEGIESIEIDSQLAIDMLAGKKRPILWVGVKRDGKTVLVERRSLTTMKYERVEGLTMQELSEDDTGPVDIRVEVGKERGAVLIHFNDETIRRWQEPVKLYFTAEGNPTFLKCAFSLDVNIMNEITSANGLTSWPNPLVLRLPQADDVSVYTAKSNIKMVIIRHEASNHRV